MNIYGDESGSIDNVHYHDIPYFVICLIRVINKASLKRSFKRFVASNLDELKRLDGLKPEPKMFKDGKFVELKGSYFDRAMKKKFVRDRPAFCVNLQAVIG